MATTQKQVAKLFEIQSLLARAMAELESVEWTSNQCCDTVIGEHYTVLEKHIDNAQGRCSTLCQSIRRIK